MHENPLSRIVVDAIFQVHKHVGPVLFESVYEELLAFEFEARSINYRRQQIIPIQYKNAVLVENAFKADFIIENKIILELKSIEQLAPVHYKQVLTYLRLSRIRLGILVNFNEVLIKEGIHRIVNNLN